MSKSFGWVMLILGAIGVCLDVIWIVELTFNFGEIAIPNSPNTSTLMIWVIIVFGAISLIFSSLGIRNIRGK